MLDVCLKRIVSDRLKEEEGFSSRPYRCTSGKLTIGYGRNLDDVGISKDEAETFLENDIVKTYQALVQHLPDIFKHLDKDRQGVLFDMAFNLGIHGLLKFKKMLNALSEGDYQRAANELLDSKYAKQVPSRARRNANILVEGIDCCWRLIKWMSIK